MLNNGAASVTGKSCKLLNLDLASIAICLGNIVYDSEGNWGYYYHYTHHLDM